jgi:glycosyltransferase involved in cell wall biosynthesis
MSDPLTLLEPPAPDFARMRPVAPLVTIGIPAYNRPHLLRETLASLAAQQNFADFEVVVCDDGELAETHLAVEQCGLPNIRYYVNRPRLGAIGNWNRCLQLAAGPWVTVLHEDDTLYPWFLATIAPHLRAGIAAVAVHCVQGNRPPTLAPPTGRTRAPRVYVPAWFLKGAMTPFPGVVFPRELALRLGGFDPRQGGIADYAFWYALACAGRIVVLPETAAFYRVGDGQWTEREWPAMLRHAHLLRLRIAREQFSGRRRLGRWLARFYTGRLARAYARRFADKPAGLLRAARFQTLPFAWLPSGWVWKFLQLTTRPTSEKR